MATNTNITETPTKRRVDPIARLQAQLAEAKAKAAEKQNRRALFLKEQIDKLDERIAALQDRRFVFTSELAELQEEQLPEEALTDEH